MPKRVVTRDELEQAVGGLYWVKPGVGQVTMDEETALALLAAADGVLELKRASERALIACCNAAYRAGEQYILSQFGAMAPPEEAP